MIRRPTLYPGSRFEVAGRDRVAILTHGRTRWLEGEAYPKLIPLLDGTRTLLQIVEAFQGTLQPEVVHYLLALLEKNRFIVEQYPGVPASSAAFWLDLGADPREAQGRLAGLRFEIQGAGAPEQAAEMSEALSSWGPQPEPGAPLLIVLSADYRSPPLNEWNNEGLRTGRSWCLVNPFSRTAAIGPVIQPGLTACWSCLSHRLEENRLTVPWPDAGSPAGTTRSLAIRLAATEIAKWAVLGERSPLHRALLTFDPRTVTLARHPLFRRPQCPACGEPREAFSPLTLRTQCKTFTSDGGYRTKTPAQTLLTLERHLSPITGIVPRIASRDTGYGGPIFTTALNGPLGSGYHRQALAGRPLPAAGKGLTRVQARVSCLAESIERYSMCARGDEAVITATAAELCGDAVPPAQMLCFSEAQYLHRETWNRNNRGVQWIPEPYEGHVKLDWVAATSLTHHGTRYVPAAICYLGYLNSSDRRYCFSDSNGCAAGNTLEEAILQGFLELVERDAIALWWYNRVRRPPCDPRKLGDAELRGVEEIQGEGRSVSLLDLTADLGIPAIAAISANERGQDIRAGFGAHLDPRLAIRRAISELQQAFLRSLKPGQRELTLENSPQLTPLAGPASVPPPYAATDDLRDDILFCLEAARRRSLEVLVVNLTRPEIDFPVVRVLAPGLRHYRLRLAPGRLYQAPVDAGWLPQPLSEQELCSTIPPV